MLARACRDAVSRRGARRQPRLGHARASSISTREGNFARGTRRSLLIARSADPRARVPLPRAAARRWPAAGEPLRTLPVHVDRRGRPAPRPVHRPAASPSRSRLRDLLLHLAAAGGGVPRRLRVVLRSAGPSRSRASSGSASIGRPRPSTSAAPSWSRWSADSSPRTAGRSTPYLAVLTFEETCEIVGLLIGSAPCSDSWPARSSRGPSIELLDARRRHDRDLPEPPSATAPGPKAEQLP